MLLCTFGSLGVPGEYTRVPVTSPPQTRGSQKLDDETKLLHPAAYARVITNTPPASTSESAPSSHSIVEVTPA